MTEDETIPPSPNPDLPRQLEMAARSGDPNKALDALVAAGVVSKEARDGMIAEEVKQKEGLSILAHQISNCTEGVRILSHHENMLTNALNKVLRDLDIMERAWKRAIPGFKEILEEETAKFDERREAEEVKRKSAMSQPVTTTKVTAKSPQMVK